MKPHKWAKEIKAWADGEDVEYRYNCDEVWTPWGNVNIKEDYTPMWHTHDSFEYRIKPQPKEPQYLYVLRRLSTNDYYLRPFPSMDEDVKTIGKIKLEQDDVDSV